MKSVWGRESNGVHPMQRTSLTGHGSIPGEGPLCDTARGCRWWIAIEGRTLHLHDPQTGRNNPQSLPRRPGFVALHQTSQQILGIDWAIVPCSLRPDGYPGRRSVFGIFAPEKGLPDAVARNMDGNLWCGLWRGRSILRLAALGRTPTNVRRHRSRSDCPHAAPDVRVRHQPRCRTRC